MNSKLMYGLKGLAPSIITMYIATTITSLISSLLLTVEGIIISKASLIISPLILSGLIISNLIIRGLILRITN